MTTEPKASGYNPSTVKAKRWQNQEISRRLSKCGIRGGFLYPALLKGKRPMQRARFVWGLGLLLVLSLGGSVVGCGCGAKDATDEDRQAQKDIRAQIRKKQIERDSPKSGPGRRGNFRPKGGQ